MTNLPFDMTLTDESGKVIKTFTFLSGIPLRISDMFANLDAQGKGTEARNMFLIEMSRAPNKLTQEWLDSDDAIAEDIDKVFIKLMIRTGKLPPNAEQEFIGLTSEEIRESVRKYQLARQGEIKKKLTVQ